MLLVGVNPVHNFVVSFVTLASGSEKQEYEDDSYILFYCDV